MSLSASWLTVARPELEEACRLEVEERYAAYRAATARYRKLLAENPDGLMSGRDGPLPLARQAEAEALAHYMRAVMIFTGLVVHGRIPEEQGAARADAERP